MSTPLAVHRNTSACRIGWRPHSLNPIAAGVRYRCLNPLRHLQHQHDLRVELFDANSADHYSIVVYQALCVRHTDDALAARRVLDEARTLKRRGAILVIDECDNHFHNPKGDRNWERTSSNIRELINLCDHIVTSTASLASEIRTSIGATKPITVIGDAVEGVAEIDFDSPLKRALSWKRKISRARHELVARKLRAESTSGSTQLVWFGNHGTTYADGGMLDLLKVRPLLERLNREHPLSLTVISNSELKYRQHIAPWSVPSRYVTWERTTFLRLLPLHHIALIPITRNPFTLCKSNNRLTSALACGLAVVADSIPSYEEFSSACMLDNWEDGLASYLNSPELRHAHVRTGQALIDQQWTQSRIAHRWKALFLALLAPDGKSVSSSRHCDDDQAAVLTK